MQHIKQLGQYPVPIRALFSQLANSLQQGPRITGQQGFQHPVDLSVIEAAKHRPHIGRQHLAFAKGNRLVGQAHGVAHRTIGRTPQQPQRIFLKGNLLGFEHMSQVFHDTLGRHALQGKLQATRQNGHRQLLRVGGCQQELDVRRRLFKGLEQRIEGMPGEHVHFVDQVDLETPTAGCVLHVFQQLTSIFDLGTTGRVHLDEVDKTAFIDFPTDRALPAGRGADTRFAVQALGDDPRNGGLAHATGTGEQVGMVQTLAVQSVDQGFEHVCLADHLAERTRTPFACKNLITHGKPSPAKSQKAPC